MTTITDDETPEMWALAEFMGHRRMAGKVTEQTIAGAAMIRVDVFVGDATEAALTQLYGPSSVFCITPMPEELCRRFSQRILPQPVHAFELPVLERAEQQPDLDDDDLDDDDDYAVHDAEIG